MQKTLELRAEGILLFESLILTSVFRVPFYCSGVDTLGIMSKQDVPTRAVVMFNVNIYANYQREVPATKRFC